MQYPIVLMLHFSANQHTGMPSNYVHKSYQTIVTIESCKNMISLLMLYKKFKQFPSLSYNMCIIVLYASSASSTPNEEAPISVNYYYTRREAP